MALELSLATPKACTAFPLSLRALFGSPRNALHSFFIYPIPTTPISLLLFPLSIFFPPSHPHPFSYTLLPVLSNRQLPQSNSPLIQYSITMSKSRLPLVLGLGAAGGVGYYLYSAGGNPKAAENKFESMFTTDRQMPFTCPYTQSPIPVLHRLIA